MKKLYARDVLTVEEYEIIHEHFASDEAYLINTSNSLHFDNKTINKAHETASKILASEPLERD